MQAMLQDRSYVFEHRRAKFTQAVTQTHALSGKWCEEEADDKCNVSAGKTAL